MSDSPTIPEEETLGKAYDARLMRRLLGYLRPHLGLVFLAIAVLIAAAGLEVVGPWLTQKAIDEAIPAGDRRQLAHLALLFLMSLGGIFVAQYVQQILTTWLGQKVMLDLRREIFTHLQRLDLRYYDKNPVGRLMTRITSDVETLNELFSSGIVTVFGDIFTLVFIIVAMLRMDWVLALITFTILPLVVLTAVVFRAKVRVAYRDIRVRLARINAFLHERLTGMRVVQLFGTEVRDLATFRRLDRDYLEAHLRSITYYALFFPLIEFFTASALALILWWGGGQVLGGAIQVGVMVAFIQYARRFFRPIQDLSEKYNLLQGAMASSERVFKLLDQAPAIPDSDDPLSLPNPLTGRVEFRHVWFAYGESNTSEPDWVLRDVSFVVEPGEKLAIVGHTGAGKSTIINLLMRFYVPQRGEILIDGVPVDRVPQRELRAQVALVLQDVFLFSEDVRANIRLGSPHIDEDRVRFAAEQVGAAPFIERLPGGYGQALGERGASLSVGERQLISFARALAFDPRVLILDEATSSVDSEIEARVEAATDRLMEGRTSLVIAHRLSTVQNADRILVLHHGEVVEQGTHSVLLQQGGLYARLYELQFVRTGPAA